MKIKKIKEKVFKKATSIC